MASGVGHGSTGHHYRGMCTLLTTVGQCTVHGYRLRGPVGLRGFAETPSTGPTCRGGAVDQTANLGLAARQGGDSVRDFKKTFTAGPGVPTIAILSVISGQAGNLYRSSTVNCSRSAMDGQKISSPATSLRKIFKCLKLSKIHPN